MNGHHDTTLAAAAAAGPDNSNINSSSSSSSSQTVFVTGGGGYVGSHCVMQLLKEGFDVIAVDNYANSIKGEGYSRMSQ